MIRILLVMMVPFVCLGQKIPREGNPINNGMNEPENVELKRKASFNLEEIKVRWKKAALENCTGVPCTTTAACSAGTPSSSPNFGLSQGTASITPITIATTGATGIGTATGLPSGISATWAGNVITISGTIPLQGSGLGRCGTFNYTIPLTGCSGVVNATGTIIVNCF